MGNFRISCQLAHDIAIAYGLGNSEATTLYISHEGALPHPLREAIDSSFLRLTCIGLY